MRLYRVAVEYETVVLATDERAAEAAAERVVRQEDDLPELVTARPIDSVLDLPAGWDKDCRPWGERDPQDRPIGQILDTQRPFGQLNSALDKMGQVAEARLSPAAP